MNVIVGCKTYSASTLRRVDSRAADRAKSSDRKPTVLSGGYLRFSGGELTQSINWPAIRQSSGCLPFHAYASADA